MTSTCPRGRSAINGDTGKLELLNQQSSGGSGPCHVVVDRAGKNVLVANYGGGSVACLPIKEDGRLGEATGFAQHAGKGADPRRQEGPHAHSINLDPANRFAFVADLGLDQVLVYHYDSMKGTLTRAEPALAVGQIASTERLSPQVLRDMLQSLQGVIQRDPVTENREAAVRVSEQIRGER